MTHIRIVQLVLQRDIQNVDPIHIANNCRSMPAGTMTLLNQLR